MLQSSTFLPTCGSELRCLDVATSAPTAFWLALLMTGIQSIGCSLQGLNSPSPQHNFPGQSHHLNLQTLHMRAFGKVSKFSLWLKDELGLGWPS